MWNEGKIILAAMMGGGLVYLGQGDIHPAWGFLLVAGLLSLCWPIGEGRPKGAAVPTPKGDNSLLSALPPLHFARLVAESSLEIWRQSGQPMPKMLALIGVGYGGGHVAMILHAQEAGAPPTPLQRCETVRAVLDSECRRLQQQQVRSLN